jgi:hypothetical protein
MRAVTLAIAVEAGSISHPSIAYICDVQRCVYFKWGWGVSTSIRVNLTRSQLLQFLEYMLLFQVC